jgi:1-acyl-sn-glycerol-3-phosphate acyltransferase
LGLSVCIFPEGGVPDDESLFLDTFKDGAFLGYGDHQIPILPITLLLIIKTTIYTFSGSQD